MEHVSVSSIDPEPYDEGLHTDRRDLAAALGSSELAVVRYALAPGERLSGAVHAHPSQEEVFVVLDGEATFETETGTVTVTSGEAVRFASGEFQSGGNESGEDAVVLALGAPRDSETVLISRILTMDDRDVSCPECGHDAMRIGREAAESELVCPECAAGLDLE